MQYASWSLSLLFDKFNILEIFSILKNFLRKFYWKVKQNHVFNAKSFSNHMESKL